MLLKMSVEIVDSLCENGNLNLGRTRVAFVCRVLSHYGLLFFLCHFFHLIENFSAFPGHGNGDPHSGIRRAPRKGLAYINTITFKSKVPIYLSFVFPGLFSQFAHFAFIIFYLDLQVREGVKALLRTEEAQERNLDKLAVEVALEVENMRLY